MADGLWVVSQFGFASLCDFASLRETASETDVFTPSREAREEEPQSKTLSGFATSLVESIIRSSLAVRFLFDVKRGVEVFFFCSTAITKE